MDVKSLSVLLCTYNRAGLLTRTLAALSDTHAPDDCRVEVVVVDNNSTDTTREVVREAATAAPWPIRYAVEPAQGKSYALNKALSMARGDVLALTDDDVLPSRDWLARIVEQFRTRDIVFVFGKVLPLWDAPPPPELLTMAARDIWGPLALIDYGDEPTEYSGDSFGKQRLPIGANFAVRRDAVEAAGGWRTDLGKVDNSLIAGEDRELCVRMYRSGLYRGLYDPGNSVRHLVPASRLRRSYFRRWFFWHGRTMARMTAAVYPEVNLASVPHVAGVPRFLYRQFLEHVGLWLRRAGRRDALALLDAEVKVIEFAGFFAESWRRHLSRQPVRGGDELAMDRLTTGG
jgi:glycosyltransferase involved in cell wall biosynthesis